jgi:hypothetical protein
MINLTVKKLLNEVNIDLGLVVESFNISQSKACISFKCTEESNVQAKNWAGKATVLIAKTLMQLLVMKNAHERKMKFSEVSVDINWPDVRVDLIACEPYKKLKQMQLLGLNIFDIISFNKLYFEPGQCNVGVISHLL